jgi:hypothetical protein
VNDLQVVTSKKGAFNFIYTPDVTENWAVAAQWQTDKSYYTSAYSEPAFMEVTAAPENKLPIEYVYVGVIAIVIVLAVFLGYLYINRTKK